MYLDQVLLSKQSTHGLNETQGSIVIFDENQVVSDLNEYELLYQI